MCVVGVGRCKGGEGIREVVLFFCFFVFFFFFFFKQKTAYELLRSLVGSEMCIRYFFSSSRRHTRSSAVS